MLFFVVVLCYFYYFKQNIDSIKVFLGCYLEHDNSVYNSFHESKTNLFIHLFIIMWHIIQLYP
jgi:hypothetical protein